MNIIDTILETKFENFEPKKLIYRNFKQYDSDQFKLDIFTLAVKLETTLNQPTYPQTSKTIHKPAKPPTNHPQTSQTTLKPTKYQTNHPLISQKLHRFFPEDIFYEPQHVLCPSRARRELDAFF